MWQGQKEKRTLFQSVSAAACHVPESVYLSRFFPSLAVFLFNPIYLLFQLFVYETCRGLYLIKHRNGSFFFARVQVRIGVPRHFDFGVSQPSRHLLNVDTHVGEQGGVGMAKIVYAYPFDTRERCI